MVMFFGFLLLIPGIAVVIAALAILRGWALSILWGWFIVPLFGLPAIGILQAVGLSMTLSLFTHQYVPPKDGDKWGPFISAFLSPLFALLLGYIVRQWL